MSFESMAAEQEASSVGKIPRFCGLGVPVFCQPLDYQVQTPTYSVSQGAKAC